MGTFGLVWAFWPEVGTLKITGEIDSSTCLSYNHQLAMVTLNVQCSACKHVHHISVHQSTSQSPVRKLTAQLYMTPSTHLPPPCDLWGQKLGQIVDCTERSNSPFLQPQHSYYYIGTVSLTPPFLPRPLPHSHSLSLSLSLSLCLNCKLLPPLKLFACCPNYRDIMICTRKGDRGGADFPFLTSLSLES